MRIFRILALSCLLACSSYLFAQTANSELSLAENLATPEVPKKAAEPIRKHISQLMQKLKPHYADVETIREGEALLVTIPCADLFAPNSTILKESGKKYLRPFVGMVKLPTMYKLLVAVYSDNTGEEAYLDQLTQERAQAIDEFLCKESATTGNGVIPYGMGMDDPITDNENIVNRSINRRVEIIIVPEWQMIETARSGKLRAHPTKNVNAGAVDF